MAAVSTAASDRAVEADALGGRTVGPAASTSDVRFAVEDGDSETSSAAAHGKSGTVVKSRSSGLRRVNQPPQPTTEKRD